MVLSTRHAHVTCHMGVSTMMSFESEAVAASSHMRLVLYICYSALDSWIVIIGPVCYITKSILEGNESCQWRWQPGGVGKVGRTDSCYQTSFRSEFQISLEDLSLAYSTEISRIQLRDSALITCTVLVLYLNSISRPLKSI